MDQHGTDSLQLPFQQGKEAIQRYTPFVSRQHKTLKKLASALIHSCKHSFFIYFKQGKEN